jgi:hypothetical protein
VEAHLVSAHDYIGYSDPIELELHSEQERNFTWKFRMRLRNESLIDQGEIEFEVVEYPNNSNPHPPPEEPISSEKIFDNLDGNNEEMSLTFHFQPLTHQRIQYKIMGTWKAIAVYKFQIITNSGWPSTMTVICINSQNFTRFVKLQSLVE